MGIASRPLGINTMKHKQLAIQALEQMKGDDSYRAQCAFRDMTQTQMQEQHGQSGKTRAQILEEYAAHDREIHDAIAWVKGCQ